MRYTAFLAAGALLALLIPGHQAAQADPPTQPNVVFIMLDDVGQGFIEDMPTVQSEIVEKGVSFSNGITPTSLCCPSRASTLTGNYAHTTGVYTNDPGRFGGWPAFQANENSTLATHLQAAGYRTALVGKYLNGYETAEPNTSTGYVPEGWSDFRAFKSPGYYDYVLTGTINKRYGASPADYSTDVVTEHAVDIVETTPVETPLFLYYAPYAAHAPFVPAPRHAGLWDGANVSLDGAFNEADMSDKPSWLQDLPKQNAERTRNIIRNQHEMLLSADEGVAQIIAALGDRAENTLFVVMGDNGFLLGAHRLSGKNFPYQKATNVPMAIRYNGTFSPTVSKAIMLNIDLTATIADLTDTSWPMDGISYLDQRRPGTVLEQTEAIRLSDDQWTHPGYCGYRTENWLYVEWNKGYGAELYRYTRDPYELNNLAQKDRWQGRKQELRALAQQSCSPVPPGFNW